MYLFYYFVHQQFFKHLWLIGLELTEIKIMTYIDLFLNLWSWGLNILCNSTHKY
jgi:hypothetical protein